METYYSHNTSAKMAILLYVVSNCFFRENVILHLERFVRDCPVESRLDLWSHGLSGAELFESLDVVELSSAVTAIHES
jgi:hypothetical protein